MDMTSPFTGPGKPSVAVLELAERFRDAGDIDACWSGFLAAARSYGFAGALYAYQMQSSHIPSDSDFVALSSYPAAWVERYVARRYLAVDPVAHHCMRREAPTTWEKTFETAPEHPDVTAYIEEARDFGLRDGLAVPLRDGSKRSGAGGTGFWARDLTQSEMSELIRGYAGDFQWMTWLFHSVMIGRGLLSDYFGLSPREIETLKWAARGLTTKEIAHRLSIAYKTADHHLSRAVGKLRARNRTHAVAKALVFGIIEP